MSNELLEKLEANFDEYVKVVGRIKNEDVRKPLLGLCEELKNRLAATPASTQTKFVGAYPGGLVEHSLNVARTAWQVSKAVDAKLDADSLLLVGLAHDLGKVGTETEDYYLEKKSDWHNERGIMFEVNENISNVSVAERSVWWLNNSGVRLSQDELSAILSLGNVGHHTYASQFYNAPLLTVVLQTAVRATCIKGTGRTSILD